MWIARQADQRRPLTIGSYSVKCCAERLIHEAAELQDQPAGHGDAQAVMESAASTSDVGALEDEVATLKDRLALNGPTGVVRLERESAASRWRMNVPGCSRANQK